ncbi:MAG TPA: cupin domain-containing protein [Xanthobacteraceae bacterium]|jgi:quercetin dioxygenase-like cupin family protein|nr:cupin domain-containing protein [Xanthobacteraceae bacterium]
MKHASAITVRLTALTLGAAIFAATPLQAAEQHHTVVPADSVKWGPAPPSLPPGAQAAVLMGSPAKEGPFVIRLKFPAGFVVPPHRHSKDEFVTVMAGKFAVGSGEKLDRESLNPLPPASFVHLPAGMPHYAWAEVESVVQINGTGPFDVSYIDPKDDPRKQ